MTPPEGLFGEFPPGERERVEPVRRIRAAVTRIRGLRGQVGHDGLTPSGVRTLIDELAAALEACAEALASPEAREGEAEEGGRAG